MIGPSVNEAEHRCGSRWRQSLLRGRSPASRANWAMRQGQEDTARALYVEVLGMTEIRKPDVRDPRWRVASAVAMSNCTSASMSRFGLRARRIPVCSSRTSTRLSLVSTPQDDRSLGMPTSPASEGRISMIRSETAWSSCNRPSSRSPHSTSRRLPALRERRVVGRSRS